MKQPTATPLAIIGIGCLFPKAGDAKAYWANLREGVDAITEVPSTHWRPEDHYDPDPSAPDKVYAKRGGFLDAVQVSPLDLGIAPRDIEATDTTQLLSLHVAAEAMRDAGYGPGQKPFARDRVGVVLGVTGALELVIPLGARLGHPIWKRALAEAGVDEETAADVVARISDAYVPWQENSFPGLLGNVAAGRIANRLDLHGTNCVVDAACASSLSALHLAALELEAHRADMVLAGGVDTFNDVFMYTCFSKTPALSATGDVRPFDQNADGTMLGEGVGIVAIKRLDDARRDGDRIYAVIKGIGSSSDGKGQAIYAPDSEGQARALRTAYRIAGVSPTSIELLEAHGTGTKVGDATELRGLRSVYAPDGDPGVTEPWCAVGSVKSMIGHTKAAAGVAGLIKAALALQHKVLPPTLKVERPSTVLDDGSPFYVSAHKLPWLARSEHPRRAGVSAFGFGGSNFHCVLEEAPPQASDDAVDWDGRVLLFAFGASSRDGLIEALGQLQSHSGVSLRQQAADLRARFEHDAACRLVFVSTPEDLQGQIAAAVKALQSDLRPRFATPSGIAYGEGRAPGRLAGMFPGQGAQAVGMLGDLACQFPLMRTTVESVLAGRPEIARAIYPPPSFDGETKTRRNAALTSTDVAQPALGAVSLGASRVLQSFGVELQAAVGHSYGELVALCAAGRLPAEQLGAISCRRGELMAEGEGDRGAMLAVRAGLAEVQTQLDACGLTGLTIANRNAPKQMVLSGSTPAIELAAERLAAAGLSVQRLGVAAAFHSPLVAAAHKPFSDVLASVPFDEGSMPVYANATGVAYPASPAAAREVLAGQLTAPVEFVACVESMVADGVTTFVELGPGRRLCGLVSAICADAVAAGTVVVTAIDASAGGRHGVVDLARCIASLAAWGHHPNLTLWDPQPTVVPEAKNKLRIPVCGANAKPVVPARPPRPRSAPTPVPPQPLRRSSTSMPPHSEAARPPMLPSTTAPVAALTSAALEASQANLAALMRLQEQTADLHRRFLEGQEQATRAFGALVAQQQAMQAGAPASSPAAGLPSFAPVAPVTVAPPSAVSPSPAVAITPPIPAQPEVRAEVRVAASPGEDVASVLLDIIAAKTGYPPSMLELSMGLDADLGIDSIKRVEILSALAERLPALPKIGPEQLGELQTLGQIVEYLGGSSAPLPVSAAAALHSATPAPVASAMVASDEIAATLLDVVSTKTGYPVAMLELEMGLDADLGIDSIKRVEILSALAERLPGAPVIGPEQLGELTTLGQIVAFLGGSSTPTPTATPGPVPSTEPVVAATPVVPRTPRGCATLDHYAVRYRRNLELGPVLERSPGALVVTGPDDRARAISDALARAGIPVSPLAWGEPLRRDAAGLVVVAPVHPARTFVAESVALLGHASPVLRGGGSPQPILLGVTALGGSFGFESAPAEPRGAALGGLIKTAAREWPEVTARILDLPADATDDVVTQGLAAALRAGPVEIGCDATGVGTPVLVPLLDEPPGAGTGVVLGPNDVVLVSGGARGVTGAVAVELARTSQASFVLLGRSPAPGAAPAWLGPNDNEAEIKRKLVAQAAGGTSPKEIGRQCAELLAAREIRGTMAAIRAAGGRADYRAVDVRDAAAVNDVVASAATEYGPITVLVHGAGVLADRRIEDKSVEDVERVYGTKVDGAENLLVALNRAPLEAVVLFSSSTARFGRVGQSDYAMANEVLNKLGQRLAAERPELRVASVGWGPWDGGMVTPALARIFEAEGVKTIALEAGARFLVAELARGGAVESVVVGAGSALDDTAPASDDAGPAFDTSARRTAFERTLSLGDHPFLRSHVLSGKAVLPTVMMLEWFAHAALAEHPGLCFAGVDDLQVCKGVRLGQDDRLVIRVETGASVKVEGQFIVPVELCSGGTNGHRVLHARARVVLAATVDVAPSSTPMALPQSEWAPAQAYAEALFHGEGFRALEAIDGLAPDGIVVHTKNAPLPKEWMTAPVRRRWVADPLALDAGLQAMIVWSATQAGAVSLPNRLGRYRQFGAFPAGGAKISVRITGRTQSGASAELDWTDRDGKLLARLTECEYTLDPGLRAAFARNQVE